MNPVEAVVAGGDVVKSGRCLPSAREGIEPGVDGADLATRLLDQKINYPGPRRRRQTGAPDNAEDANATAIVIEEKRTRQPWARQ